MNILEEIISHKRQLLERQKKDIPQEKLLKLLDRSLPAPRFQVKIAQKGVHLIAELKKASPSAGIIREDFDFVAIAKAYEKAGASCLSVLTEDEFFLGELPFLDKLRQTVSLPLLRKDFIIDEYQLYESKVHSADAVLLIASLLEEKTIKHFLKVARTVKLDAVLEVHDETELQKALDCGVKTIGINARNLVDFSVDLNILPNLLQKMPSDRLVICESGIKSVGDLAFIKNSLVHAVLIGETLMRAKDVAAATKEFVDFLKKQ